ncbi:hypothetical protein [Pedobacter caeni]|uniref:Uncharacterized protein n=1 Tax=Pedobacter caeni TaxID=288992 RepID=A0A1M4TMN4_9SPHI|nr:hypothetical protein [Pedobacter caeni]SHE45762.1 hypothetical protein SAMN04488522_101250 [Pedobacter caeni]
MDNLFFFLKDKKRLKFLLLCIAIAAPILIGAVLVVNYYEANEQAAGTPNDKGGISYYYRESDGAKELPKVVTNIVPNYTSGQTTYFNVSTDSKNKLGGNLYVFTKDDFAKVKEFYKQSATIIDESDESLEIIKNKVKITISKEKIYEDDPIQNETKFNVYFP